MEKYRFTESDRILLERSPVPMAVYQFVDREVHTLVLSDGFCEIYGYPDQETAYCYVANNVFYNTHPDDLSRTTDAAYRFALEDSAYDVVFRARKYHGTEYRIVHGVGKHVYTPEGVRLAYVWFTDEGAYTGSENFQAVSLNRAFNTVLHEESILKATHFDYLTGLPSMTYFFELADRRKEDLLREGSQPVLLYMDFCGMKHFNTKYGFSGGDDLLKAFAQYLLRTFPNDFCSRFGSDQFMLVTKDEGLEETLEQLFEDCRKLNGGNSLELHVGIYRRQEETVPVTMACDRAKFACNALKGSYASGYNFYSQDLRDEEERQRYVVENLDRAIEEKWIQVYYQPIVRAVSGKACDDEALSRWIDPVEGFLSPADFIPALEKAGTIYKLDLYVLEQILEKIRIQTEAGLDVVPQSVNLSRSDFAACDIVEEIRKRVDAAGFSRSLITIEITESVIGDDFDFMKAQIVRFQELGFPVWMDDFGSGYSSLDVLQSIKFNLIKFDMSFMRRLHDGTGKIILTEMVRMATALGVDTVCEGVETEEQVRFLQEIGCSKLQGYYYSKPIPLSQIMQRYEAGTHHGYENPQESGYFETIGRVNLYDLAVIASEDEDGFQNSFSTLPMAVLEIREGCIRFVRSNPSYRAFMQRFFGLEALEQQETFADPLFAAGSAFMSMLEQCCQTGNRMFYDQDLPDGTRIHSFARRISVNEVTKTTALVVAVLSVLDEPKGTSYENIARALAADYYNIFYVDLETNTYHTYSTHEGEIELEEEQHGGDFFETFRKNGENWLVEEDKAGFLAGFTKENILRKIGENAVFTMRYRLDKEEKPLPLVLRAALVQEGRKQKLIVGIRKAQ